MFSPLRYDTKLIVWFPFKLLVFMVGKNVLYGLFKLFSYFKNIKEKQKDINTMTPKIIINVKMLYLDSKLILSHLRISTMSLCFQVHYNAKNLVYFRCNSIFACSFMSQKQNKVLFYFQKCLNKYFNCIKDILVCEADFIFIF